MDTEPVKRGYSLKEAAAYLGVSQRTFERLVKENPEIQPLKISTRRIIYDIKDLDRFLEGLK